MNKINKQIKKITQSFKKYHFQLLIKKNNPEKIEKQLNYIKQYYNPKAQEYNFDKKFNINKETQIKIFDNIAQNIDKIPANIFEENIYFIQDLMKKMFFERNKQPQLIKILTVEPRLFKSAIQLDRDVYSSKKNDFIDIYNQMFVKQDYSDSQIAVFLKDLLSLQNKKYDNIENQEWALNIFRYFYSTFRNLSYYNPYLSNQHQIKDLELELPHLSPIAEKIKNHIDYMDNYNSKANKTWGALTNFNEEIFKFDEQYSNSSTYIKSYISLIHHCQKTLEKNKEEPTITQDNYEKSLLNLIEYQKTAFTYGILNNFYNEYKNNNKHIRKFLLDVINKNKHTAFFDTIPSTADNSFLKKYFEEKECQENMAGVCHFISRTHIKIKIKFDLKENNKNKLEDILNYNSIYDNIKILEPYYTLKQKNTIQKQISKTTLSKNKIKQIL